MTTTAQLNVRLQPELKAAGDSVLELYGISPSELIRTLWEKISHGEEALGQVVRAFATEPAAGSTTFLAPTAQDSMSLAQAIRARQQALEAELGLDPATYVPVDMDELEDAVYQDYLEERLSRHAD